MKHQDLYSFYKEVARKKLSEDLKIKNVMSIPRLLKIVVNVGLGEALENKKVLENTSAQLAAITGQKGIVTHARKDISTFKLRKGDAIGVKVTLRKKKMYDFLEKLVRIVLPRIRDFRGVSLTSFDRFGNYTLGLREQTIFPEIEYSQIDKVRGMEITFVTNSENPEHTKQLLKILGMPFKKEK